ncbi:DUF1571 domain-containing protein [Planctomycetota bacterium]
MFCTTSIRTRHLFFFYSCVVSSLIAIGARDAEAEQTPKLVASSPAHTAFKIPSKSDRLAKPLSPVIDLAVGYYNYSRKNIRDYSCILVRQERVDGQLRPHEFMQARVRNQRTKNGNIVIPFSVYLKVLKPSSLKGREVLFVAEQNKGDMLVRNGGNRFEYVKTRLKPGSAIAMRENRYPITEFGIENLTRRLILSAKQNLDSDCSIQILENAQLNERPCRELVITNNDRSQNLPFQEVRVLIDVELKMPVHYEAYDWPRVVGGTPELLERYTYLKIETNQGFTAFDFDPANPVINVQ